MLLRRAPAPSRSGVIAYIAPGYQTFKALERRTTSDDVRDWGHYW